MSTTKYSRNKLKINFNRMLIVLKINNKNKITFKISWNKSIKISKSNIKTKINKIGSEVSNNFKNRFNRKTIKNQIRNMMTVSIKSSSKKLT